MCLMRVLGSLSGLSLLFALGCSSVGSSAVRTDGGFAGRHMGAVRVYAVVPPNGVRVIGLVEVHAVNEEANVETLMPVFMKRVADIGGTGGVIDDVQTHFEMRTEWRTEHYSYPCGYRSTCWSTRVVPYTYQIRMLRITGRALLPLDAPGPPAMVAPPPGSSPGAPPTTAPPPKAPMENGGPR